MSWQDVLARMAAGSATGAGTGLLAGSFIPGVGNVVGAAAGGLLGAAGGLINGFQNEDDAAKAAAAQQQGLAAQQQSNSLADQLRQDLQQARQDASGYRAQADAQAAQFKGFQDQYLAQQKAYQDQQAAQVASLTEMARQRAAQQQALYDKSAQQVNPYGAAGLSAAHQQAAQGVNFDFANANRQELEGLAARGMVGSGLDAAASANIAAQRAAAHMMARNNATTQYTDKQNAWEQAHQNSLLSILNSDGGASLLSDAARQYGGMSGDNANLGTHYGDSAFGYTSGQFGTQQGRGDNLASGLMGYYNGQANTQYDLEQGAYNRIGQRDAQTGQAVSNLGNAAMLGGSLFKPQTAGTTPNASGFGVSPSVVGKGTSFANGYGTYKPKDDLDFYGPTTTNQNVGNGGMGAVKGAYTPTQQGPTLGSKYGPYPKKRYGV